MKFTTKLLISRATLGSILLASLMLGCNGGEAEVEAYQYALSGDTIQVSADHPVLEKLKTETIEMSPYRLALTSSGVVKAIPNQYAEIAPPFAGRVTKVHLKLGMAVQPGTALFEMVSPEFLEAQKGYFQAKTDLQTAELTLNRQKDLHKHGVGSVRDLEEAQAIYSIAKNELDNTRAALQVYGVNINSMVFGQPMIIRSPIKGEVITNEVVNGHFIKDDDEAHATVADLSKIWVIGMVKEKDIRFIHELDKTTIELAAFPGKKIEGKVYHIEEIIDPETRSAQVLIECDNPDGSIKPGMYASVLFEDEEEEALFVPANAILQYNDRSYVFLKLGEGKFRRQYVQTGVTQDGKVQILEGLALHAEIVTDGAFYLLDAK